MHHFKVKPLFTPRASPDGRFGTTVFNFIFRTPEGSSKGCAFIKLQTAQQAMTAIQQMHGSQTMPVSINTLRIYTEIYFDQYKPFQFVILFLSFILLKQSVFLTSSK